MPTRALHRCAVSTSIPNLPEPADSLASAYAEADRRGSAPEIAQTQAYEAQWRFQEGDRDQAYQLAVQAHRAFSSLQMGWFAAEMLQLIDLHGYARPE